MDEMAKWIKEHEDVVLEFSAPSNGYILLKMRLKNGTKTYTAHRYVESVNAHASDILNNMRETLLNDSEK